MRMKSRAFDGHLARYARAVACAAALAGGAAFADEVNFISAQPVWAQERQKEPNVFLRFRGTFDWRGNGCPMLRITGATIYRAQVNGAFVGYGPARTAPGLAKVDEWPVRGATNGLNTVEIDVCSYQTASFQHPVEPAFLQAEVVDGSRVLAQTPADFTATELPRVRDGLVYSRQRGFPTERWTVGGGERPVKVGPVAGARLVPRGVPYPTFERNAAFSLMADGQTYELPRMDAGFVGVKVACETPAVVSIRFDEALVNGKLDLWRNGDPASSWHAMNNVVTWGVAKPGVYELESIEPYALKYATVTIESGRAKLVSGPWVRQYRNPLFAQPACEDGGEVAAQDPELKAIFDAARNSLAVNGVDLYTDCAGRERSAWLCDSRFSAEAAYWLAGDTSVERHQLRCFAQAPCGASVPQGGMTALFPGSTFLPTYMLWYVLQCEECAARAGADADAFKRDVRDRVLKNIAFLEKFANADGLLEGLPGWVFVEWSKANALTAGVNYPVNALWSAGLASAGRLYGRPDWVAKAERIKAKVREQSFDGTYFRDHAVRGKDGKLAATADRTEVCQYYMFYFGIADRTTHAPLWNRMVTGFGPGKTADGVHPADMFFGRMLRLDLLGRAGLREQLVAEIKACFGRMASESGAFWEFVDGHDSRCHAFGSYVTVMLLRDVLGKRKESSK